MALPLLTSAPLPPQPWLPEQSRVAFPFFPGQSPLSVPWILELPLGNWPGFEWERDDELCRLVGGGDLGVSAPEPRLAEGLRKAQEKAVHPVTWRLLDGRGRRLLEGGDAPNSRRIKAALASAGYRSTWERREAFLEANPENGEGWVDLALHGLRLARLRLARFQLQGRIFASRLPPEAKGTPGHSLLTGSEADSLADGVCKELADGLDGLLKVPDWTRCRSEFLRLDGIHATPAAQSPRMRGIAERMRPEMLEAWRGEPEKARGILGEGWGRLGILLGDEDGARPPWDLEPQLPPSVPEVLRLVCFGKVQWLGSWEALRGAGPLLPWVGDDLRWEFAASVPTAYQQHFGWTTKPRWALFQGEDLLASGLECPSAGALADRLSIAGPSRLQRLDAEIAREPAHLDARRRRFNLVLPKMPQPALEWNLAEDARWAWIPLPFGPKASWHPDPEVWTRAALKALPPLEDAIRHWPSQMELWRAWVSWAAFHPQNPSVLDLAREVHYWGPHSRWVRRLPREVHEAVAESLRARGDFEAMREWFQEAREGLGGIPQNVEESQDWMRSASSIYGYLREALLGLHREADAARLDLAWHSLTWRIPLMRR